MLSSGVLGLIVGVILALTGAGGGILAVPLLVFGAGLGVAEASPIALLAVGIAAALGAGLGLREGIVRYKAALMMAGTGMLLSTTGIWLANRVDGRWLGILFAVVMLWTAYKTVRQAHDQPKRHVYGGRTPACVRNATSGRFVWTRPCAFILALSGAVAGLLSGLLGVGGGFVMVPALQRHSDLAMPSVIATSLAVIALLSVAGVASSILAGHLDWQVAVPFSAGTLAGMIAGRLISSRLSGPHLKYGFALVSALVAVGMIGKALHQ